MWSDQSEGQQDTRPQTRWPNSIGRGHSLAPWYQAAIPELSPLLLWVVASQALVLCAGSLHPW